MAENQTLLMQNMDSYVHTAFIHIYPSSVNCLADLELLSHSDMIYQLSNEDSCLISGVA
jgi:tRNA (Thr-GGU) A37 N-methylase